MFIVTGKIVNQFRDVTQKTATPFTTVQVMMNGDKKMRLQNVTDWENRNWEIGKEVKIPVMIKPWSNGQNISVTALKNTTAGK